MMMKHEPTDAMQEVRMSTAFLFGRGVYDGLAATYPDLSVPHGTLYGREGGDRCTP